MGQREREAKGEEIGGNLYPVAKSLVYSIDSHYSILRQSFFPVLQHNLFCHN